MSNPDPTQEYWAECYGCKKQRPVLELNDRLWCPICIELLCTKCDRELAEPTAFKNSLCQECAIFQWI